jgi:glycerol-3-phosphate cytidylyltransferase
MKIVLFQGAWEIINYGHVRAFERAKKQGDYLIVALNTNRLLEKYKGRKAVLPWYQKKRIIESIKWVDKVIPAHNFSPLELLKKHNVDVYVLTKEWEESKKEEIAYMKAKGGKVSFSPRYAGVVCTSEIKRRLLQEEKLKDMGMFRGKWILPKSA